MASLAGAEIYIQPLPAVPASAQEAWGHQDLFLLTLSGGSLRPAPPREGGSRTGTGTQPERRQGAAEAAVKGRQGSRSRGLCRTRCSPLQAKKPGNQEKVSKCRRNMTSRTPAGCHPPCGSACPRPHVCSGQPSGTVVPIRVMRKPRFREK